MSKLKTLKTGGASLSIAPEFGGRITALSVGGRAVLKPVSMPFGRRHIPTASMPLVPFSNRISGRGFLWDGQFYDLPQTLESEALPIHGDGFLRAWTVSDETEKSLTVTLAKGQISPFSYQAEQSFELSPLSLTITLSVKNSGPLTLPFGLGFHPWFPRDHQTKIQFNARGYWEQDEDHCSTVQALVHRGSAFDYSSLRRLPDHLINTGFTGWTGDCVIRQSHKYVSVRLSSSTNLGDAMLFSPAVQTDYFCFEPVSHPVDAFNLPAYPGLKTLSPGQSLKAQIVLDWRSEATTNS